MLSLSKDSPVTCMSITKKHKLGRRIAVGGSQTWEEE